MASTLNYVGIPDKLSPVFNPMVFYIDGSSKAEAGFKYIIDLYSAGTNDRIARYKPFPRPNDGYGIADVNQVLQSQVTYTMNQNNNSFISAPNDYIAYDVSLGEEYIYFWPFDDNLFTLSGSNIGQTTLSSFTNSNIHYFQTGDTINVTQPSGTTNGVYTVIEVPNVYSIVIDKDWVSGGPAYSGTAVYADFAKTIFYDVNTTGSTGNVAWNGAVAHQNFMSYTSSTYVLSTINPDSRLFLTTVPDNYRVTPDNSMWLHYYNQSGTTRPNKLNVQTYDRQNVPLGLYSYTNPLVGPVSLIEQVAVGPYNLTNFNPTGNTISGQSIANLFNDVEYYDVWLTRNVLGTDLQISQKKRFYLNKSCFKYTNIEIYFLDRFGSFIPVNFQLQSVKSISVNKSSYDKYFGDLSGGRYQYASTDFGKVSLEVTEIEQIVANSDWLNESEVEFLREVYTSPVAYIKEKGQLWPIYIQPEVKQIPNKNNKKNIAYQITFEKAYQNIINNVNG
jgi:hypothetical protein